MWRKKPAINCRVIYSEFWKLQKLFLSLSSCRKIYKKFETTLEVILRGNLRGENGDFEVGLAAAACADTSIYLSMCHNSHKLMCRACKSVRS